MNNKLTAVQWMARQIITMKRSDMTWNEILNQAMFMEKEQIIEAYCKGDDNIGAEQYYKETYES